MISQISNYRYEGNSIDMYVSNFRYTLMNKAAIFRSLQSERLAVSIRHRNIVTIYHVNDRSDPAFVIMEYVGESYIP